MVDFPGWLDSIESMNVDTLKIAQRLQAVGIAKEASEAHAEIIREAVEEGELVTKADLREAVAGVLSGYSEPTPSWFSTSCPLSFVDTRT